MEKFDIEKINTQLERCANPQKETWSRGIVCTQMPMLVVKSCDINAIVKSIKFDEVVPYLEAENFKYYENTIVYAKILHKVRDFQAFKHYLGKLLPIIDNWATVDSIIWQCDSARLQVQSVQKTNCAGCTNENISNGASEKGKAPLLQVQSVQGTNIVGITSELDYNEVCELRDARLQVQSMQKTNCAGCTNENISNGASEKGKAPPLQVQSVQKTNCASCTNENISNEASEAEKAPPLRVELVRGAAADKSLDDRSSNCKYGHLESVRKKCNNDFENANNLFELSKALLVDERPFARRTGVRILFKHLDDQNIDRVLALVKTLRDEEEYYVNMCVAWLLCDSFIKQREKTLSFLTPQNVNEFVFHKTISKCCDSFRVSATDKTFLRNLLKNILANKFILY